MMSWLSLKTQPSALASRLRCEEGFEHFFTDSWALALPRPRQFAPLPTKPMPAVTLPDK
jgi:hypothetical protein